MLPCHVTSQTPPSQPLPDLLCSCPVPPTTIHSPAPDAMDSLIVVTEYEAGRADDPDQVGARRFLSQTM